MSEPKMKTDEEGNGSRERRGGKSHMTDFTMEQMSKTLKSLSRSDTEAVLVIGFVLTRGRSRDQVCE